MVAAEAEQLTGVLVDVTRAPWPAGVDAIEFRSFVGSYTAFHQAFGWQPETPLSRGVHQMLSRFYEK
jgi:nucleoside-diphosphate-sugar epimerase